MGNKSKIYEKTWKIMEYLILIFTVFISVFPILWVIMSSFKSNKLILGSPFALPDSFGFEAYIDVLTHYSFITYLKNSLWIATISTILGLIIYSLSSYVFAKFEFKGKNIIYSLFIITLLVPVHAKAQPIFSLIMKLGLYDTKAGLTFVYTSFGLALSLFILKNSFSIIPKSLDEAAFLDGANFWQVFVLVNLPLVKSGLATAGILMFLNSWNEYFYAIMLTTNQTNRTIPVALSFFNEAFSYNYTRMFAAITIAVLPGIVIYAIAQEQVLKSVASSGVKG